MSYVFIKALLFGISISAFVGPLLFTIIHSGMRFGLKKAIWLVYGTWISDLIILLSTFLLISRIPFPRSVDDLDNRIVIIMALLLIILGITIIFKKSNLNKEHEYKLLDNKPTYLFLKGFIINTVNPAAFFIWLGLAAYTNGSLTNPTEGLLFYSTIFLIIIGMDILKLYLGEILANKLTDRTIDNVKWISGLAFTLSGFLLIFKYVFH